jgi:hypothetical protein
MHGTPQGFACPWDGRDHAMCTLPTNVVQGSTTFLILCFVYEIRHLRTQLMAVQPVCWSSKMAARAVSIWLEG